MAYRGILALMRQNRVIFWGGCLLAALLLCTAGSIAWQIARPAEHNPVAPLLAQQLSLINEADSLTPPMDTSAILKRLQQQHQQITALAEAETLSTESRYHLSLASETLSNLQQPGNNPLGQRLEIKPYLLNIAAFSLALQRDLATRHLALTELALAAGIFSLALGFALLVWPRLIQQQQTIASKQRHQDELLRQLADTSPIPAIIFDAENSIRFTSKAAEKLFQTSASDILSQPIHLLIRDQEGAPVDLTAEGQQNLCGYRDNVPFNLEVYSLPLQLDADSAPEHLLILKDISHDQQVQVKSAQAQKMEALGQLTGGIAHDFNNLLLIIQGNLTLLEEDLRGTANSDKLELLQDALSAVRDGSELTDRLLSFSRRQALKPEACDINHSITQFQRLLEKALGANIGLRINTKPDLPYVRIDSSQLQNALLNLAINARDAMPEGGDLRISTNLSRIDEKNQLPFDLEEGNYIAITVSDTGTGMPDEVRRKVFDPFFTTKAVGQGTGMGLSMVYGFVKQSKGGITIRSVPGKGTVITLLLPALPPEEYQISSLQQPQMQPATQHPRAPKAPRGTESVLVVEDDDRVRKFASSCLRELGYAVTEARSGDEAHDLLVKQNHGFHAIFCDMIMPGQLDGTELAKWTHEMRPDIRILMTTGYSQATHAEGESQVPFDVLYKPYSREDLAKRMRNALEKPPLNYKLN